MSMVDRSYQRGNVIRFARAAMGSIDVHDASVFPPFRFPRIPGGSALDNVHLSISSRFQSRGKG